MIKFIQCIKSKPGLSLAEFRQYWQRYQHNVREVAEKLGAVRAEASTTLAVEANMNVMVERGTDRPFDAVIEVHFENATGLAAALEEPAAASKLEVMQDLQAEFIDLKSSSFFFATEDQIYPAE